MYGDRAFVGGGETTDEWPDIYKEIGLYIGRKREDGEAKIVETVNAWQIRISPIVSIHAIPRFGVLIMIWN